MILPLLITLVFTHATEAVLGLALGCWYKRNDNGWNKAIKELDREIVGDTLRTHQLAMMMENERQANAWSRESR